MEVLLCAENLATEYPCVSDDPTILDDPEVLENLLALEPTTMPVQNYFNHIQLDIEPFMRKLVATWMLEVCEEQGCEDQVFAVAMNYLDRFLCVTVVQRAQLQLVGAVCLLLASKIRQCKSLSIELLAYYTENSISHEEIIKWELVVVSKLGWDLSPVTPGDYLEHLIRRVPGASKNQLVRRHASTFIALATTESDFLQVEPSAIAVGALIAAIRGLRFATWGNSLHHLASVIRADPSCLIKVVQMIEVTIEKESAMLPQDSSSANSQQQPSNSLLTTSPNAPLTPKSQQQSQPMEFFDGNETPTDITEIMF